MAIVAGETVTVARDMTLSFQDHAPRVAESVDDPDNIRASGPLCPPAGAEPGGFKLGLSHRALTALRKADKRNWGILLFIFLGIIAYILFGTLSFDSMSWKGWYALFILLLLFAAP
jgi:hypothetical protein